MRTFKSQIDERDAEAVRAYAQENLSLATEAIPHDVQRLEDSLPSKMLVLNASLHTKVRHLHAAADTVMSYVLPRSPCRASCSGCCHSNVTIHSIEASYIERNTGRPLRRQPLPPEDFHRRPCVFLEGNLCGVYDSRPLVCRTHVAMMPSAYWCQPERSLDEPMPMLMLSGLRNALGEIVLQSGDTRSFDIRQLFDPVVGPSG